MTSDTSVGEAYVWIWLPGRTAPVVAGLLTKVGTELHFNYGRSYLARSDAIAIYDPELPLLPGYLPLIPGLSMPSCIRDAAPDAWGRRVIMNRRLGRQARGLDPAALGELEFLLESGSDRVGALDFQTSPLHYHVRGGQAATLADLLASASRVERGIPLSPELDGALLHGTSIGGARPKAMLTDGDRKLIAKFSQQSDVSNVVKAEFIAMRLAKLAGLSVADVSLASASGKDVLLIERFDRQRSAGGWRRRGMVSALTLLELDEMMARYASYEDLAAIVRQRFVDPRGALQELFARLSFNVLCGNTDDHARNHAAFWDGQNLALTPAYDICPQARTGGEATQAMLIVGQNRASQLAVCLQAAPAFAMSAAQAIAVIGGQIASIRDRWPAVCDEANLNEVEREFLWRRQFLNPYAFEGAPEALASLAA